MARTPTRLRLSGALAAWMVPLDSPSVDLQLGGGVVIRWLHTRRSHDGFHHVEMWRELQRRNTEMVHREEGEGEGEGEIEMYRGSREERI